MGQVVETSDVQSLVFSSHARLPHSVAAWLTVRDPALARAAMRSVVADAVGFGLPPAARVTATQILLSAAGLRALGVADARLQELSRPFLQGASKLHRRRALGDLGRNDPTGWAWHDCQAHALVLVYATDPTAADRTCAKLLERLAPGWECTVQLPTRQPADGREHFGFRDGLARTHVDLGDGSAADSGADLLPPGEVLLGYRNALGVLDPVPPLGRNGSYVVVRQLEQDVHGFWQYWRSRGGDEQAAVWLASKAVGRWPNGMPVSGARPVAEPPYVEAEASRPLTFRADRFGDGCPPGAHVRRANPRDGLGADPAKSLAVAAKHRIHRRGRVYGPPPPIAWRPMVIDGTSGDPPAAGPDPGRGLLFICLCADIARQFEFIQQTWLNNPKHSGRFDEVDLIAAGDAIVGDGRRFSIPRNPIRLRLDLVAGWVTVRGSGYFLLPGRQALTEVLAQ